MESCKPLDNAASVVTTDDCHSLEDGLVKEGTVVVLGDHQFLVYATEGKPKHAQYKRCFAFSILFALAFLSSGTVLRAYMNTRTMELLPVDPDAVSQRMHTDGQDVHDNNTWYGYITDVNNSYAFDPIDGRDASPDQYRRVFPPAPPGEAYYAGMRVDVLDTVQKWYTATILDVRANEVYVHYESWSNIYDEWITVPSDRIAPAGSVFKPYQHRNRNVKVYTVNTTACGVFGGVTSDWFSLQNLTAILTAAVVPVSPREQVTLRPSDSTGFNMMESHLVDVEAVKRDATEGYLELCTDEFIDPQLDISVRYFVTVLNYGRNVIIVQRTAGAKGLNWYSYINDVSTWVVDTASNVLSIMYRSSTQYRRVFPPVPYADNISAPDFYPGMRVDVLDTVQKWYTSTVLDVRYTEAYNLLSRQVKVHYESWGNRWDEWVADPDRIAPAGSVFKPYQHRNRNVKVYTVNATAIGVYRMDDGNWWPVHSARMDYWMAVLRASVVPVSPREQVTLRRSDSTATTGFNMMESHLVDVEAVKRDAMEGYLELSTEEFIDQDLDISVQYFVTVLNYGRNVIIVQRTAGAKGLNWYSYM